MTRGSVCGPAARRTGVRWREFVGGTAALVTASAAAGACGGRATASRSAAPAVGAESTLPDRTRPPSLLAPGPLKLPPVITRQLPNELRLLVVEHHELPVADFVLVVGTGGEADPADKVGTATLAAALLKEGTRSRNSLAIADQEAYLGVDVNTNSGWDATTIALHTPTAKLDSALALFADVTLNAVFPENELERLRKNRLTSLLQLRDRGPAIADRAFAAIVYGRGHPYGRPLIGDETSTNAIRRDDVQRFYESYFRPNNATMIVVGDVKPDDVERRVRALFGGWQQRPVPAVSFGQPPSSGKTTVYLIDKANAPQSSFRIGAVGVPRSTEDYFPLIVMNTILGDAFTSRLNNNLRETKGYTYGAGSGFGFRRSAGPFTARAEIVAAKSDSALLEFFKELRGIRDPVPHDELEKAKRYLQLQLPGDFETTGAIAGQLVPVVLHGLPLDYYNGYIESIERVTQADVQRVAAKYINPEQLAVVIVGDQKAIEAALRAARIGEVVVRDFEGREVKR